MDPIEPFKKCTRYQTMICAGKIGFLVISEDGKPLGAVEPTIEETKVFWSSFPNNWYAPANIFDTMNDAINWILNKTDPSQILSMENAISHLDNAGPHGLEGER